MPGYFLVDIREIKDAEKMDEDRSHVAPSVEKFGGRYLVRGGPYWLRRRNSWMNILRAKERPSPYLSI